MKTICGVLLAALLLSGCEKNISSSDPEGFRHIRPLLPKPGWPLLPRPVLPLARCIDSYDDFLQALGTNHFSAKALILSNGVTLVPGPNLNSITYDAIRQDLPNSLFGSRLTVEWRFPDGNWQDNTSDVWSLGCIDTQNAEPPFTNIMRGTDIFLINTCFFWCGDTYTGEQISYVVIE